MELSRRSLLLSGGAAGVTLAFLGARGLFATRPAMAAEALATTTPATSAAAAPAQTFAVTHTDAEWRKLLTPMQYSVLRKDDTEQPFSSPLDKETRKGVFACAGCALDLYSSDTKYDSGTGWPSFWAPLDKAVLERTDTSFGLARTAVSCSRCGGHLGHVFDDGPPPTGLRYCMNGVAMTFTPTAA